MIKHIILSCYILCLGAASAQESNFPNESLHNSCATAANLACYEKNLQTVLRDSNNLQGPLDQFVKLNFSSQGTFELNTMTNSGSYTLYGPFPYEISHLSSCEMMALGVVNSTSGTFNSTQSIMHGQGYYILKLSFNNYLYNQSIGEHLVYSVTSRTLTNCDQKPEPDCKDCLKTFAPLPGKYILSVWVRGEQENKNKTYQKPVVNVGFNDGPKTAYVASGKIIDEWQKIEALITVPTNATTMQIELGCLAGTCYFDDFRFYPTDGSMVSYAYDPISLRLVAQLDERNYATFYEYDEEGQLIRVKKETERGIMTIQENNINIAK